MSPEIPWRAKLLLTDFTVPLLGCLDGLGGGGAGGRNRCVFDGLFVLAVRWISIVVGTGTVGGGAR